MNLVCFPVTIGGDGFIGKYLVKDNPDMYVVEGRDSLEPALPEILYLTSTVTNYNVFVNPFVDIETNQIHTIRVLDNARKKFGRDVVFNFVSTWFVYGKTDNPAHEDSVCNPNGFYSITRYAGELLVRSYCEVFGIRYRILRLANVIGVGDLKASLTKNALVYLLQEISKGKPIKIYDSPSYRDCLGS